ncbi:hypothetical protein ACH5RR_032208 [Cinchona calisaya]|uniref:Uncharacterized protein n=1 Tax=Cinchona calisaya TaxID=153742 RepID=A0ABD2YHG2_9GENT
MSEANRSLNRGFSSAIDHPLVKLSGDTVNFVPPIELLYQFGRDAYLIFPTQLVKCNHSKVVHEVKNERNDESGNESKTEIDEEVDEETKEEVKDMNLREEIIPIPRKKWGKKKASPSLTSELVYSKLSVPIVN